jgi:transcriptional regulator with XRE-family HTH domain
MLGHMNASPAAELGEFLRARRSRVHPGDIGLQPGSQRKVSGLRREELALLAGVSADYYQRIEQGRATRPSAAVLDALANALGLTEDEARHLHTLAAAARRPAPLRRRRAERVPGTTLRLLAELPLPAMVLGSHLDILAANGPGAVMLGEPGVIQPGPRNPIRDMFLHPDARTLCPDWESTATEYVGMLRAAVAADPDHPRAVELVGELSVHSPDFRRLWARHEVRQKVRGSKQFYIPQVGTFTLDWDAYPLPGQPGPVLVVYTAPPGSPQSDAIALLRSLSAPPPP